MRFTEGMNPRPRPDGLSRRKFCSSVGVGAAAAAIGVRTASSQSRVFGANEALRIGVVGVRSRGQNHVQGLGRLANVRIAALCDVDAKVLDARLTAAQQQDDQVVGFRDVRKMLDSGAVDAISVATPNHTHALIGVWAAERGIHSYIEKPVAHDVWQGRQLVAAARKYGVCIQTGSQCRSMQANHDALAYLKSGDLGAVRLARGLCYKPRGSIGRVDAPRPAPAGVDYDLWLGPAPQEPVRRSQFHYDWHWQWNYGNGDLGNQGVHQMDLARWFVGQDQLPGQVLSFGGRWGYVDDGETPNTQVVWLGYDPAPVIFEVRGLPAQRGNKGMDRFLGASIGVVVHCEHGYVTMTGYNRGAAFDLDGRKRRDFEGGGDHYQNFIDAVRAEDASKLAADVQVGHVSAALCDLGNRSYRSGVQRPNETFREHLQAMPELNEAFLRVQQHLRANAVDLDTDPVRLGRVLSPVADGSDQPRPQQREGFALPELI